MNNVKIYNTKQKSYIKDLFINNPEENFTIEQLLSLFVKEKKLLSKATLYRTLDMLISSGDIIKYNVCGNVSCYKRNNCESDYVHFVCTNCNSILNIKNPILNKIETKINHEYGIEIDCNRTMLYGVCHNCRGAK